MERTVSGRLTRLLASRSSKSPNTCLVLTFRELYSPCRLPGLEVACDIAAYRSIKCDMKTSLCSGERDTSRCGDSEESKNVSSPPDLEHPMLVVARRLLISSSSLNLLQKVEFSYALSTSYCPGPGSFLARA
jgi:hypothetical protein